MRVGGGRSRAGSSIASAVQIDVADEFDALTELTAIAADDKELIEDTSASSAKKYIQSANKLAGYLKSATTLVDVKSATAPSSGQALIATGASAATWQTISAGAWWSTRDTTILGAASSWDDEFTSDTSANYAATPSLSGSAIDAYATIATNPRVSWAGRRPSHLSFQPADAVNCFLQRTITLETNHWIWARAVMPHLKDSGETPSGTETTFFGVYLSENAGVANEFLGFIIGEGHDGSAPHCAIFVENDGESFGTVGRVPFVAGVYFTQILVQKISGAFYMFAATDDLVWTYVGTHSYGGDTLDNLILRFNDDGGAPGSNVIQLDFIRTGSGIFPL